MVQKINIPQFQVEIVATVCAVLEDSKFASCKEYLWNRFQLEKVDDTKKKIRKVVKKELKKMYKNDEFKAESGYMHIRSAKHFGKILRPFTNLLRCRFLFSILGGKKSQA